MYPTLDVRDIWYNELYDARMYVYHYIYVPLNDIDKSCHCYSLNSLITGDKYKNELYE